MYPSSGLKLPPAADFGKRVGKQLTDAVGTPDVWTQQHVFNQAILHCAIGYWVKEQSSEDTDDPEPESKAEKTPEAQEAVAVYLEAVDDVFAGMVASTGSCGRKVRHAGKR